MRVRLLSARIKPSFNLGEIPDHATLRDKEAARKFSALLQLIDR